MLIQTISFLAARFLVLVFNVDGYTLVDRYILPIIQATIALFVSRKRRNEPWWQVINFIAPVAAALLLEAKISPTIYFAAFLLLLGFNWHVMRNRVPYFPSGEVTWAAVERVLPSSEPFSFIDIGSGMGGLNFYLAKRKPLGIFTGVEISPIPFAYSFLRSRFTRSNCVFQRRDFFDLNLSPFDVVFAYLSPAIMSDVWKKALQEMRPGTKFVSFEFDIPSVIPDIVVAAGRGGLPLYIWTIPSVKHGSIAR
jgi:SAM-dependent methyltransferase